jgi:hypothetical protein
MIKKQLYSWRLSRRGVVKAISPLAACLLAKHAACLAKSSNRAILYKKLSSGGIKASSTIGNVFLNLFCDD